MRSDARVGAVSRRLVIEADGGSRGNPGPAGYGAVVRDADTGEVLAERAASIGRATNNVAEYQGLLAGLRAALDLDPASVEVRMDSKLVVEQMSGRWKVRHPDLAPLHAEGVALVRRLPGVRFGWIPRERNAYADRLANDAMDAAAGGREWTPRSPAPAPPTGTADNEGPRRTATGRAGAGRAATGAGGAATGAGGAATGAGGAATGGGGAATGGGGAATGGAGAGGAAAGGAGAGGAEGSADPTAADSGAARSLAWRPSASPPTTLLLVRHGNTPLSGLRYSGRGDPALTAEGEAQARAVAARLAKAGELAAVVSSPLRRAHATAAAIATAAGVDVAVDDGLVEADFGRWDGLTFAEVRGTWPAEHSAWLADSAQAPPGGESLDQVARRVRKVRDRLLATYPARTVAVVSHVTPIKLLVCSALGAPPSAVFRIHLDTASLSTVDWYPDGPAVVRLVNDTGHLSAPH
jgi:ribonuclease H / adenosylcobalamin/alpha-ribazole phosphatase